MTGTSTGGNEGTVYLLHLDPPVKHARHYTGWTSNLDGRLEAHRQGRGARLLEVVKEAGGTFRLVRTWPGSRVLEHAIKDMRAAPKLCPECSPRPLPLTRGHAAGVSPQREPAPVPEAEVVPGPDPRAWLMPGRGRPAGPDAYAEALPVTDRLIAGWRAQLDTPGPAPEPEADLELEALPAGRPPRPVLNSLTRRKPPVSSMNNGQTAATDPGIQAEPAETWPPDQPVPYSLTPLAEAALTPGDQPADQERQSL